MSEPEKPASPALSKAEITREIGKALSERRQLRNVSLDKVYRAIKIRLPYLEAMEQGNWDELPGEVFVRGFVNRYAGYLGLDAKALLAPYMSYMDGNGNQAAELGPRFKGAEAAKSAWIWVGLAVVLIVALVNFFKPRRTAPKLPASPPPAVEAKAAAPAPVPEPEKHQLSVYSQFPLWLRVQAENKTFEGFIRESSTWTWADQGRFSIRLGHTNQVSVLFDGQPVELKSNQKKVELPAE